MWWQRQNRVTHPASAPDDRDCIALDDAGRLCPFPAVATVHITCKFNHRRISRLCAPHVRDTQAGHAECNEGKHSVQVTKVVWDK